MGREGKPVNKEAAAAKARRAAVLKQLAVSERNLKAENRALKKREDALARRIAKQTGRKGEIAPLLHKPFPKARARQEELARTLAAARKAMDRRLNAPKPRAYPKSSSHYTEARRSTKGKN